MIRKNFFSILIALIIMYLSLTTSDTFKKASFIDIPFIDKIIHFGMYSVFMSTIVYENRKYLNTSIGLFLAALIPVFYGIFLEILQAFLTSTRSGSFYDFLANLAGIMVSVLLWLWLRPQHSRRSDSNIL